MKIKLNNFVWEVSLAPLDESLFGLTDMVNLKIYLSPKMNIQNVRPTIIHELVHATMYSYGIYMNENDDSKLSREQLCEFVAMHLDNISLNASKIEEKLFN